MDSWTFLHCADLHLDTPFTGLKARDERIAERLRQASFQALDRIVEHAIERKVDGVLIAGDSFDSEDSGLAAQFALRDRLERLREAGIPAFIIAGNHDPLPSWSKHIALPENTTVFGMEGPERVRLEKEGRAGAEIVGMSFPDALVKENLASRFPDADPERVSIALLHATVGSPEAHAPYAPFRAQDVEEKGYELWALGHIHKRGTPREAHPMLHYPGNPQGRHPNEGGPKGCSLIELRPGNAPRLEFLPTHSVRYETGALDLSGVERFEALEEKLARELLPSFEGASPEDSYILRLRLEGRTPLHWTLRDPAQLQDLEEQLSIPPQGERPFRWVDRLELHTRPEIDPAELRERGDLLGELWRAFDELEAEPDVLKNELEPIVEAFGGSFLKKDWKALDEEERKELLERARWTLVDEFLKGEGAAEG